MKFVETINAVFFAASPALAVYAVEGVGSLAYLMCLLLIPLNLWIKKFGSIAVPALFFWVSIVVINLISLAFGGHWTDSTLFYHNLYPIAIFFISLIFFSAKVNIDVFRWIVTILACLAAGICIFQRIELIMTGSYSNIFFLPGFEVKRDIETFTLTRPSAFFTEPAHLAIFLSPVFYMLLAGKRIVMAIFVATGILFSGSTTGFILVIVLVIYSQIKNKASFWRIFSFVVIILAAYAMLLYYYPDVLLGNIEKLSTTDADESKRLLGGLQFIQKFNLFEHIFGIGLNQLDGYMLSHGAFFATKNYANALIYSYISYGIIGFALLLIFLRKVWKISSRDRGFFIILFGVLASDQVLFNVNFLYPLIFVLLSTSILSQSNHDNRRIVSNTQATKPII